MPDLAIEASPAAPDTLPDWLHTEEDLLGAVMAYPAEEITEALAAVGSTDLPALLAYLYIPARRAAELARIADQIRAIRKNRKTSQLAGLADQLDDIAEMENR